MRPVLTIRRGNVYFARDLFEHFFPGVAAVLLLREGAELRVLPVRQFAAGGLVVKTRNAAGDRVVDGAELLRAHGIEDEVSLEVPVTWSDSAACLIATSFFQ